MARCPICAILANAILPNRFRIWDFSSSYFDYSLAFDILFRVVRVVGWSPSLRVFAILLCQPLIVGQFSILNALAFV
jgi:hypothetical protein